MSCVPIRFVVCICLTFVMSAAIIVMINISFAMPQMVQEDEFTKDRPELCSHLIHGRVTSHNDSVRNDTNENLFNWSPELQGIILGCFYWSSVIFQLPVGYAIGKYGANKLICMSMAATAVACVLTPKLTELSVYAFITLRVFVGIFQCVLFPGMFVILCSWIPVNDRSTAMALITAGAVVVFASFSYSSGYLMHAFTWRAMFYIPGAYSAVALLIFLLVPFKKPDDKAHDSIELQNRKPGADMNANAICGDDTINADDEVAVNEAEVKEAIPWISMLTNKAVLAFLSHKFAKALFMAMIAAKMPTYFASVLRIDSIRIGKFELMPSVVSLVLDVGTAKLSDFMIKNKLCTRTRARKIFSLFSGLIGPLCLAFLPAFRCKRRYAVRLYYYLSGLNYIQSAVDAPMPAEMSAKFHCMLFTMGSILTTIPGFLSPMLAGVVLERVSDQWLAWDILFYTSGGFVILTNIFFLLFASSERQDFDFTEAEKQERDRRRSTIARP